MKIQEYPKALYKDGDQTAEHVIVADADEEAAKREHGFKLLGDTQAEDQPKGKARKQAAE